MNWKSSLLANDTHHILTGEFGLSSCTCLLILYIHHTCDTWPGADPEIFQRGGGELRMKILKVKCFLIHVSTRVHVHIKTRKICNSFSLLPFQEDCLLFFLLCFITPFYFWNLKGGGCNPRRPTPFRSANAGPSFSLCTS